ncbi:hypothetical protein COCNU_09G006600 [Cocos nucifera]|uniref:LysM domain-containing protein n=1 Tax=Cocos nucifera TaxID=13894 RepID=A0A8K0IK51_COCNU|nr:hypothetical protein COCNU_09G006600 [Cocos nucifera]
MQNEKGRSNGASRLLSEGRLDGSVSPSSSQTSCSSGAKYIVHHVSKMDTLAGLAIKYGVEVADVKRMNGLATDGQMFAHKTLRIPLPGRHLPSPIHLNGAPNYREQTPGRHPGRDTLDSLQSPKLIPPQHKISPAMIGLQGYYGLEPGPAVEETEMSVYKISSSLYFEDESPKTSPTSDPKYLNQRRMSASLANGFPWENGEVVEMAVVAEGGEGGDEKTGSETPVRRRQKADADPSSLHTLDIIMEDSVGLTGRIGKSLAPRMKSVTPVDIDLARQNAISSENASASKLAAVRKSTSTSNLQESDSGSTRSSSKWTSKSDAITRPVFGSFPKPIVAWNKAALD